MDRTGGHYELIAGVPHRQPAPITIGAKELPVIARAGVSGGTWLDVWLPQLVGRGGSAATRVAPIAHGGELLGVIVVTRRPTARRSPRPRTTCSPSSLGRSLWRCTTSSSTPPCRPASRSSSSATRSCSIPGRASSAAGDAERRKLERNLHDGAQQHLVALAVKLRLAKDAVEDDPADALAMIDEIKGDLQGAITELRSLAHGIFPPLLMSGGLAEALPAAATRARCRHHGRHGGHRPLRRRHGSGGVLLRARGAAERRQARRRRRRRSPYESGRPTGFSGSRSATTVPASTPTSATGDGHGFVNMADRLGAFGGTVTMRSQPGKGTTVTGTLPLAR